MLRSKSLYYYLCFTVLFLLSSNVVLSRDLKRISSTDSITHTKVYYETGKYAGWPANFGMWNWGNEILVSYTLANYKDTVSHTYSKGTSINKFSRSLDGGLTWKQEDSYKSGINQKTFEHYIKKSAEEKDLKNSIDFTHPKFALTFRMKDEYAAGSSFYYTYDKGKSWKGPFTININNADRNISGMVNRTDYIVDGKNAMTAFFTIGFKEGDKNWREVACVRTEDGGKSWRIVSWIGKNMIMPSSVRLGGNDLLTMIRVAKPAEMLSYNSKDNGTSWTRLENPVKVDMNGHPPALLKLKDGTLCLFYALRFGKVNPTEGNGMYAVYSKDNGKTWSTPLQIRGKDGANWDIGYPRAIQRLDGKVVLTYYYNHVNNGDKFRYIASSIINPQIFK